MNLYRTLSSRILIRTPKQGASNFGNSHMTDERWLGVRGLDFDGVWELAVCCRLYSCGSLRKTPPKHAYTPRNLYKF